MTTALLILISVMWLPVALLNLGKGEPKVAGVVSGAVGALVVVGALIQGSYYNDPFIAGLLFAHGVLYCCIAYALITGLEDLRSVGNVSLTVCFVSLIYALIYYFGGPVLPDGSQLVGRSDYLAMACLGYAVLTFEVFLAFHGRLSGKVVALSLIAWVPIGLWIPAFWLLTAQSLPF